MKVDVREVLKSKSPRLEKWTPSFLINYLKRIVHEEQVNRYLTSFAGKDPVDFIRCCLEDMNIGYSSSGLERLDINGRYIFASNHPFGGIDGLMLAETIHSRFGDVRVVINDLLMNLEPLKDIFIPVNKHGRQNPVYAKLFNDAFTTDIPIVTFPAGLCSRRVKGVVQDTEWKHNFIKRAIQSQRDIVPVYFDGRLSDFFYNLSNIRTKLGIKANIEMLYLADEMFKQGGNHFQIVFGEPVPWKYLSDSEKSPRTLSREIRTKAYNLKK